MYSCLEQQESYCVWNKLEMPGSAHILCPRCLRVIIEKYRDIDDYAIPRATFAMTSGGLDPIHPGHISSFVDSAKQAEFLIVVVNDDEFLKRKKGKAFMPQHVRVQIASMIRGVDYVVPFSPFDPNDDSVCDALITIRPDIFAKGGDRNIDNIPEKAICDELGIKIVQGMGDDKYWSSSNFLKEWEDLAISKYRNDRWQTRRSGLSRRYISPNIRSSGFDPKF